MIELNQKQKNKIRRKSNLLKLHVNEFMLGQTLPYLNKNKITIDVGGRNGLYTSWFTRYSKEVHSFEPVPPVFEVLDELREETNNLFTYNKAVSNTIGTVDFYVDTKRLSNSSFINHVDGMQIQVDTITLDSMNFENVGFLKVDVEGFELAVLQGAEKLVEHQRPTCMVEIYPVFNNGPVDSTFEFFFNKDYNCYYNQRAKGLVKVDSVEHGVKIASDPDMLSVHDGDFLFVA